MIKELSNGYYIDAWWDRFSKNYIVQVKDKSGDEVEVNYAGNKEDRDVLIKDFTDEFMRGNLTEDIEDVLEIGTHVQVNPDVKSKVSGEFGVIKGIDDNKYMIEFDIMPGSTVSFSRHELVVMDDEELLEEKLFSKKKKKLPALDTLHPLEIIPDAAAGIDSFNNNNNVNNSEGGSGEAMGEALHVNNASDKIYVAPKGRTLSWYKNEIKKHKPDYNFNRLNKVEANRKPYVAYMILDRILKQEELDNAQIDMANGHKNMANNYSDDNDVSYDGDSFFKNGIEFESEEAAREYFGEGKIMPNKESEKYYWNIMHEAYDIVEEDIPKKELNESLTEQKKVSLKECLKNRDREDFDKLSECYELEMFYEAVEKDLSKEDVEAIKNYANDKRNSSEEVAAYIKGKLDEEIEGGWFEADWEVLKNSLSPEAYNLLDDITSSNMSQVYTNSTGQYKYGDDYDDYVFDSLGELENSLRYDLNQRDELGLSESFKDMYDNVYVEFRDGEPTFAYETLGDASYGMSMSKSGDIEHDLGSHEYTIMKLEDGVYYPVDGYEPVTGINESLNEAMNYVSLADLIDWVSEHGQAACDIEGYYNKYLDDMNIDEILDWIYDHEQLAKDYENHFGSLNESYETYTRQDLAGDEWLEDIASMLDDAYGEGSWDRFDISDDIDDPIRVYNGDQLVSSVQVEGGRVFEVSTDRDWVESLNEEIEQNKEAIIEEINNLILNSGFELDSNIRHENPSVGFNGSSMHWQVVRKDYEFTSADGQDGLRKLASPLVQSLDAFENEHGNDFAVTWNFGVDGENHVTCGFDVRSANRGFFNN